MKLEIITPASTLFTGEVSLVQLPGIDGLFEILKSHAPLVSALVEGEIVFGVREGKDGVVPILSGFAEVTCNHVTACVEVS